METTTETQPTISVTGIVDACESMKHYWWKRILKKREETPAMQKGTQFHMLVLEPEKFYQTYFTDLDPTMHPKILTTVKDLTTYAEDCGLKLKGKKDEMITQLLAQADNELKNEGVIIYDRWIEEMEATRKHISKTQWDQLHEMQKSVMEHLWAKRHLANAKKEVFIEGDLDGVHVRGRLDWMIDDPNLPYIIVIDNKQCPSSKFFKFKSKVKFEWLFVQAAVYTYLVEQKFGRPCMFVWMATESVGPFITEAYNGNEAMMEVGLLHARKVVAKLKECLATNTWPGYSDGMVHPVDLSKHDYDEAAEIEMELESVS